MPAPDPLATVPPRRSHALVHHLVAAGAVALAACAGDPAAPRPVRPAAPASPPRVPLISRLPTLRLTTIGSAPITTRETYVAGSYEVTDTLGAVRQEGTMEVRGRGNSTWFMAKKPYRLRLGASAPLLGMPLDRHWALLANYSDKTLIRNEVAFEFSRRLGFAYTPRAEQVELYLNGSYDGIYQIAEHVRLGADRVNVPELRVTDTSATAITGGYLLEVDETRGEAFCFSSVIGSMIFCAKSPETLLEPGWERHRAYIVGYVNRLDSTLFSPGFADPQTGYAAYLDVPSTVDNFLLQELFKNVDGNLRRSTFMFKPRGGKLTFGPVWDFDIAMGNVNYDGADRVEGWHALTAIWYSRLFADPAFDARVRARWRQLRADGTIDGLFAYIATRRAYMDGVQGRNFERWPILDRWVWPNRVVTGSYGGEVGAMQDWLRERVRWMDGQLGR